MCHSGFGWVFKDFRTINYPVQERNTDHQQQNEVYQLVIYILSFVGSKTRRNSKKHTPNYKELGKFLEKPGKERIKIIEGTLEVVFIAVCMRVRVLIIWILQTECTDPKLEWQRWLNDFVVKLLDCDFSFICPNGYYVLRKESCVWCNDEKL